MTPKQLAELERVKKDIEADLNYSSYDLGAVVALRYMERVITALMEQDD